jgi:ATP phosphoribosyltransferase
MGANGFTRAGADGRLTLAVPSKGRMSQPALDLLKAAGLSFEVNERSLHVPCANAPVELLLVRTDDIPEYVQDGVVDAGITGANLLVESEAGVVTLLELGFGRCGLEAAVPDDAPQRSIEDLAGVRVATSYPVSTRKALAERGVEAELVLLSGSVEAAPRLGLADAIVDLVSTGSTMTANGLRRLGRLLDSQAVLIGNPERRAPELERLELMLRGVVDGRRRRYLMMNAPTDRVEELESILPAMGAPSVIELADPAQVALHAAVDADEIWDLLPRLKGAGATGILVLPVERVVP